MRTGEPAEILNWGDRQYRDYARRRNQGWLWVRDGRVWREEADPSEDALFDEAGQWLAPSLQEVRAATDATLLDGSQSLADMQEWARGVSAIGPRNVCVFPAYIETVRPWFAAPATVISFPHGANSTEGKIAEIQEAARLGAGEVDVVAPVRFLQSREMRLFQKEIDHIQAESPLPVKLILESSLLPEEVVREATELAAEAGVFCVKTSTGVLGKADLRSVRAMRYADSDIEIKASGGIRSRLDAGGMIQAGATIFGASNLQDWN